MSLMHSRNPDNPFNAKIQQYLERMHRMRLDVFDESSRKRPAPVEPTDGLDQTKRQRLGADVPSTTPPVPALPPGPVSYKQLYTLDPNNPNANFDVTIFQDPAQLNMIVIALLQAVDNKKLADAIGIVRSRYSELGRNAARDAVGTANGTVAAGNDDEEDYEPDYQPEDAEQTSNRLDSAPKGEVSPERIPAAQLVPYKLPEAPPLSEQQVQKYGDMTVRRVFGMLSAIDDATAKAKSTKSGFNRLAATSYDRDSWITILSRLATRAAAGLDDPEAGIKSEYNEGISKGSFLLSDTVREALHNYIMYDWKKRLDVAISWLNEEWYNDHIQVQAARKYAKATLNGDASSFPDPKGNYKKCALRLLDGIIAYIEGSDKILVRFISEIPELDREILQRMKKMAEDPDRIDLSCMVLQYLHMFRPPVREICVDVLVDMWRTSKPSQP
jgi:symplekin